MFNKKMMVFALVVSTLALFSLTSCGSIERGARQGVADGISGLFSSRSSGSDDVSSSGGSSSNDGPERNFSGSSQTVSWPQDSTWARYGLSGLRQPMGTSVTSAALYMGQYMVGLINGGRPALDDLMAQIDRIPDSQLITEVMDSDAMMVGYSVPGGTVNIITDLETGDLTIQAAQQ
jgi:hypothetical protein